MGILCGKYRKEVLKFKAVKIVFLEGRSADGLVPKRGWWNSCKVLLRSFHSFHQRVSLADYVLP